ncbi:MAG: hypothetical protein AB1791_01650 [Chloroflexota bacterium]
MTTQGIPGSGFLVVDPTETLALYTDRGAHTNRNVNYVLINVQDGRELWRNVDIGYRYYAEPVWNEDGSQVLVALPKFRGRPYVLLLSLTTDGQETEIARLTVLPVVRGAFEIRYLEWSPDQRYVHLGLYETIESGPGYVLDTETQTIYEICEPDFVEGWWLPEEEGGHLVYVAEEANGERKLKLLDVTTWQTQELLTADINFDRRNVIGWTPIETP